MKINNVTLLKINEENGKTIFNTETANKILVICNRKIIEQGCFFGEEYHGTEDHYDTISLRRVTHAIKNVRIENNKIVGDVMILDTTNGKILKQVFTNMAKNKINMILEDRENTDVTLSIEDIGLRFTPRAVGTLDNNKIITLRSFLTFDYVFN